MGFVYTSGEDLANVPEYEMTSRGPRQTKRTAYWNNANKDLAQAGSRTLMGYIIKNSFGDKKFMTVIQFHRMVDLFEAGTLEVIDRIYSDFAHEKGGLNGYDTESMGAFTAFGF